MREAILLTRMNYESYEKEEKEKKEREQSDEDIFTAIYGKCRG